MLEINLIRKNLDYVIERLKIKNFDAGSLIKEILSIDKSKRENQFELENLSAESNRLAKEIGKLFASKMAQEAEILKVQATQIRDKVKQLNQDNIILENSLNSVLVRLPNLPGEQVPIGFTKEDNEIVKNNTIEIPVIPDALAHWDLIKKYDIIDFELGNKVTGPGFPFYKGKGARLMRAIINFCIDEAVKAGYQEIQSPVFVNEASAFATGQLPDKDGMMYEIPLDKLYAIPTAEVPLTNIYRDTIQKETDLPIKLAGYTPCFRREAGSWGADVRGLNRLHQFDKVEIVQIQHPDKSWEALEEMRNYVELLTTKLGLPSRTLKLCGGDMSFTSAMTYDIEVFSAAQQKWLEVSSVSNFESYQANRLKLRFKDSQKQSRLLHTLNGSALGLPRILAAILENNQCKDGIKIPEILVPYTGFSLIDRRELDISK